MMSFQTLAKLNHARSVLTPERFYALLLADGYHRLDDIPDDETGEIVYAKTIKPALEEAQHGRT
jgi:hypothetical protein